MVASLIVVVVLHGRSALGSTRCDIWQRDLNYSRTHGEFNGAVQHDPCRDIEERQDLRVRGRRGGIHVPMSRLCLLLYAGQPATVSETYIPANVGKEIRSQLANSVSNVFYRRAFLPHHARCRRMGEIQL